MVVVVVVVVVVVNYGASMRSHVLSEGGFSGGSDGHGTVAWNRLCGSRHAKVGFVNIGV